MPPHRITVLFAALALTSTALSGCSLLIDVDECTEDSDCGERGVCDAGICTTVEKEEVPVTSNIGEDTTWTSDKIYVLENIITVAASATLTIEPGTTIRAKPRSALVVRAGGRLEADGERENPIVFTSANAPGQRLPGDWGGLAVLGHAPVNRDKFALRVFTDETQRPIFGGDDSEWNCGTIRYVRVEFGGGPVEGEEALNGLILGGCGTETEVDFVQVHASQDDGFEIFGGTFDFRHVVLTRNGDDSIDIDTGWQGTGQFLATQQDASGQNAVEVDNLQEEPDKPPLTDYEIYNYTLIGAGDDGRTRGFTFKAGGAGYHSHGIVMGHAVEGLDVVGDVSGQRAMNDEIVVENTLWFDIGDSDSDIFPFSGEEGEVDPDTMMGDDDGGFEEDTYYRQSSLNNTFGEDPSIENAFDLKNPGWVPSAEVVTGIDPPPKGFDPTAVYLGAFAPNADPWTEDWTAYPTD